MKLCITEISLARRGDLFLFNNQNLQIGYLPRNRAAQVNIVCNPVNS
jgi:hypothetical protein